jgi:hypothetical protein
LNSVLRRIGRTDADLGAFGPITNSFWTSFSNGDGGLGQSLVGDMAIQPSTVNPPAYEDCDDNHNVNPSMISSSLMLMLILFFRPFVILTNAFTVQYRRIQGESKCRVGERFEFQEGCLEIVQDVHFLYVKTFLFSSHIPLSYCDSGPKNLDIPLFTCTFFSSLLEQHVGRFILHFLLFSPFSEPIYSTGQYIR